MLAHPRTPRCIFTLRTLRRAVPRRGNGHVSAGQFEQEHPGQGQGSAASPGEKPLHLSWAMVVAEAAGARHGLVFKISTLQARAAAGVSREMGFVWHSPFLFGKNLPFFNPFLPTKAIGPSVHHPEVPVESTGAQVQVGCVSSFAASLVDQILTCTSREGAALHFLPDILP